MHINAALTPADFASPLKTLFEVAAKKAVLLDKSWDLSRGTPVFTVDGRYTSRGWTEWTQGFQYGCALLAFDGTGEKTLLDLGRNRTVQLMAPHVTHVGVHDHGFNNLSTYGNLRRLMREGAIAHNDWEQAFYDMAIKASGAVQAARWSPTSDAFGAAGGNATGASGATGGAGATGVRGTTGVSGATNAGASSANAISGAASSAPNASGYASGAAMPGGYVYSFNGPHSLFIDTMRTIRILGVAHQLGHVLMGENDQKISLLSRLVAHGLTTAKYSVYYGEGRDAYDTPDLAGRTTHEAVFNRNDGRFRCPNSQQGYSPFSTWTRGLAWAMLGFAEELEFLRTFSQQQLVAAGVYEPGKALAAFERAAIATCNFYIRNAAAADGICYWDTGAPELHRLGDYLARPADPYNDYEPVDASASAIAAQGLIRLGNYLGADAGKTYLQAGLTVAKTLLAEPYLSTRESHQGLLLHSVYHRPNGWDFIPPGRKVPCGESSLWGDYHLMELAVLIERMRGGKPYLTFFDAAK
jgi:hypothetical protein